MFCFAFGAPRIVARTMASRAFAAVISMRGCGAGCTLGNFAARSYAASSSARTAYAEYALFFGIHIYEK